MNTLKSKIKELAALQVEFKEQRKSSFIGERTFSPQDAASHHFYNRKELRYLYAALWVSKGNELEQIDPLWRLELSMQEVERLISIYNA